MEKNIFELKILRQQFQFYTFCTQTAEKSSFKVAKDLILLYFYSTSNLSGCVSNEVTLLGHNHCPCAKMFMKGTLPSILKGEVSVRLISLSFLVRNKLFQDEQGIFFSFSKQPSPNQ